MTFPVRAPDFWWSANSVCARMLHPAALIYGAVSGRKMQRRPDYVSMLPVICVGNFVAGGAGKTPVALALAEVLACAGKRPGFLSRGYGGSAKGPIVVDPLHHSAAEVGDEPLLLAKRALTLVAKDRIVGARALERSEIDGIILDDGFQNPGLKKSQSWIVVDGAVGVGNGRCIPAGPLRAPLERQLPQADMVVIMGDGPGGDALAKICARAGITTIGASLTPSFDVGLRDRQLLAYCGIGRPEKFFNTLSEAGMHVSKQVAFADHHVISESEARDLLSQARSANAVPVTTEKDFVRMKHATGPAQKDLVAASHIIRVTCRFDNEVLIQRKLLKAYG